MKKIQVSLLVIFTLLAILSTAFAGTSTLEGYDKKLHRIETNLGVRLANANARGDSWFHQGQLAAAYMDRAQLTGSFDDYVLAREAVDKAFALADPGAGPILTRSIFNFSAHRLQRAWEDLSALENAVLVDEETQLHIEGMRADIHFQRGEYALAYRAYQQLEGRQRNAKSAVRLALYYAATGQHDNAGNWLDKADARALATDEHLRAWLKLQRGILYLHRGALDEANTHYQAGLEIFPNYWLIEEHIAEVDALQGRDLVAEKSYRDLINRTNSPLFMLALADILDKRPSESEREEAKVWFVKAENIYKARLLQLPEVVAGHALDFFVESAEPKLALSLAQSNYNGRPNGESAIQLVQAYLMAGDAAKARPVLERALHSGYTSADLHMIASRYHRMINNSVQADYHSAIALRINPLADR